jgi:hypothetical protein
MHRDSFYSTKKMFLHSFVIKQYSPIGFMILQKPVKGCLHMVFSLYENLNSGLTSVD